MADARVLVFACNGGSVSVQKSKMPATPIPGSAANFRASCCCVETSLSLSHLKNEVKTSHDAMAHCTRSAVAMGMSMAKCSAARAIMRSVMACFHRLHTSRVSKSSWIVRLDSVCWHRSVGRTAHAHCVGRSRPLRRAVASSSGFCRRRLAAMPTA